MMPPSGNVRVLVLEDEPLIAMLVVDILTDAGYSVVGPAHDVEQANALINAQHIDIAVLDINLGPGVTSAPIADCLEQRGIPFILGTGYGDAALRPADRGRPRLSKPYNEAEFTALICKVLRGRTSEAAASQGSPHQR